MSQRRRWQVRRWCLDPAQLRGVTADLLRARCMQPDQFQARSLDDCPKRMLADMSGCELHHPQSHAVTVIASR